MTLFGPRKFPVLVVSALLLVFAGDAYAQRVPIIYLWIAGAGLFAPFFAVPVKLGILRLMHLKVGISRVWFLCAAEWVLWFPLVLFVMFRTGSPVGALLVLPVVLALVVWIHKSSMPDASVGSALLLSLPTPILAIVLPILAFVLAIRFEDYIPKHLL